MTLNTELTIVSYVNDDVTLDYVYAFTATEDSVIKVTIGDGIIPFDDTELIQVTEYTVTRNPNDSGGIITLVNRGALPPFDVISIIRNTAFDQGTTYPTFYSGSISEGVADETVKQTQQLNDRVESVEEVVFENAVVNPPNDINRIPVIDNTEGKAIFRGSNLTDNGSVITAGININAPDIDADNINITDTLTVDIVNATDISADDVDVTNTVMASNVTATNTVMASNVNATATVSTVTVNSTTVNATDVVATNSISTDSITGTTATVESLIATTDISTPSLELGTTEITASNSDPINFNLSGAITGQSVFLNVVGSTINLVPTTDGSNVPDASTGNPGEVPTINSNATLYELKIPREELAETPTIPDLSLVTVGNGKATWQTPRSEIPFPADGLPGQILQVDPTQTRFIFAENSGGGAGSTANIYYVGDIETSYNLNNSRFVQDGTKWLIKDTGQEVIKLDGSSFDLTQYPELLSGFGFSEEGSLFLQEGIVPDDTIDFDVSSDNSLTVAISSTIVYVKDGITNSYIQVFLAETGFRTVSVKPDGTDILVGGNNGTLYRSQTRGLVWTAIDILQDKTVNSIDYGTNSILFGFNDGTVGTTTNLDNLTIVDIGNTTSIRNISLSPNEAHADLCGDRGLLATSDDAPNFLNWILENNPVAAFQLPEYTPLESSEQSAVPFDFDQIINWQFSLNLGSQEGLDGTALDDTTLNRKINLSRESTTNYYNFWTGAAWNELFSADPEETFVFVTSAEWFRLSLVAGTYQLYSGTYNAIASTLVVDTTYTSISLTASAYDVIAVASDNEITTYDATGILDNYVGGATEVFTNDLVVSDDGDVVASTRHVIEDSLEMYLASTFASSAKPSTVVLRKSIALREGFTSVISFALAANGLDYFVQSWTYDGSLISERYYDNTSTHQINGILGTWLNNTNIVIARGPGSSIDVYDVIDGEISSFLYNYNTSLGHSIAGISQFVDDDTSNFLYGVFYSSADSQTPIAFTMSTSAVTEGTAPFSLGETKSIACTKLSEADRSYIIGVDTINNRWLARKIIINTLAYDGGEINLGFSMTDVDGTSIEVLSKVLRVGEFEYRLCYKKNDGIVWYRTLLDDVLTADPEMILTTVPINTNTFNSIEILNGKNYYNMLAIITAAPSGVHRYDNNPTNISYIDVTTSETNAVEGVIYTRDNRYLLAAGRFGAAKYMLYQGNSAANSMITFNNDLYASGDISFGLYATQNNRFILFAGDGGQSAYFEYNGNDIDISQAFTEISSSFNDFGFSSFTESTGYIFGIAGNRILYQTYDGTSIGASWTELGTTSTNLEECIITSDGAYFLAVGATTGNDISIYWFALANMPTASINITTLTLTTLAGVVYSITESNGIVYCANAWSIFFFNIIDGDPTSDKWGQILTSSIATDIIYDLKATVDGKYLVGVSRNSSGPASVFFKKLSEEALYAQPFSSSSSSYIMENFRQIDAIYQSQDLIADNPKSITLSPDGQMITISFTNGTIATGVYAISVATNTLIHRFSDSLTVTDELADLRMAYIDPLAAYVLYLTQGGIVRRYTGADYDIVDDIQLIDTEIQSTVKTIIFDNEQGIYFIVINVDSNLQAIISLDGGITWTSTVLADQITFGYTKAFSASLNDYTTPTLLYIQTDVGVLVADIIAGIPQQILRSIKSNSGATNRYACGDSGTLLVNDGSGWVVKSTGTTDNLNTVNIYTDPLEISAAGENGIFLTSTNGGDTISGGFIENQTIQHFHSTPDKVFRQYNTRSGIFYSQTEGPWIAVAAPLSSRCTSSFIYEANSSLTVGFIGSLDGGVAVTPNFTAVEFTVITSLTKTGVPVVGFALNGAQTRVHVYYEDGDIWRSDLNDLFTYSQWQTTGNTIHSVEQTLGDKYLFVSGDAGVIYRSLDLSTSDSTPSIFSIVAVGASDEPATTGVAWALDNNGEIYEGTGSGSTWALLATAPAVGLVPVAVDIDDIDINRRAYLGNDPGNNESTYYLTTDGGTTFETQTVPRIYNTIGYAEEGTLFSMAGASASNNGQVLYSFDDGITLDSVTYSSIAPITTITSYQGSLSVIIGTDRGEIVRLSSFNLTNFTLPFDGYLRWLVATSVVGPIFNWFSIVNTGVTNILDINNDYGLGATNKAYYAGVSGQMYILEEGTLVSALTNPFLNTTADVVQVSTGGGSVYFLNSDGETAVSFNQGIAFTLKVILEDTPVVFAASDDYLLVSLANGKLFSSDNEFSSVIEVDITGIGTIADIAITRNGNYALITNTTGQVFKSVTAFQSFTEVLDTSRIVSLKVTVEEQYAHVAGTDTQGVPVAYYSNTFAESFIENSFDSFIEKITHISSSSNSVVYMTKDLNIYSSDINMQALTLENNALSNLANTGVGIQGGLNGNFVLAVANEQSGTTYTYGGVAKSIVG